MRIILGAVLALLLSGAAGWAQVINGEGTFESNRGFDHAPDEAKPADKATKPADDRRQTPETSKQR